MKNIKNENSNNENSNNENKNNELNLTTEERADILNYLLELHDSDRDDYFYFGDSMVKLFEFLGMKLPTEIKYKLPNGRAYTIKYLVDEE